MSCEGWGDVDPLDGDDEPRLIWMKHKGLIVILSVASVVCLALAACGPESAPAPTIAPSPSPTTAPPSATPPSTVQPGSRITFRIDADEAGQAVAFHALHFIDDQANTLETLSFGTLEANALQAGGWSDNQVDPVEGTIQWAGPEEEAALSGLELPADAEGILLRMATSDGEAWVDLTLDGALLGRVRVTDEWRTGYLPVAEAPQFVPSNQFPQWPAGRYFPTFPEQRGRIYAIHVRTELEDWWQQTSAADWRINHAYDTMMAFTLVGMQGVINRSNPGVYLVWEQPEIYNGSPRYYLEQIKEGADVVELDLDGLSAIHFLYQHYAPLFQGTVVYDPAVPDTLNLATMIAGLENRLILAPQQLGLSGIPDMESVTDLRLLAEQEDWDATTEGAARLYQWVYDNLWPRLEHRAIAIFSPGPPASRPIPGAGYYLPFNIGARDYAVALKLPVLWLSPSDEPQRSLFDRFLAEAPSPIPVFGFFGSEEVETVRLISQHGDFCPVLTNGNAPFNSPNLSLHASLPIEPARYQAEINPDRILATLSATHVVTFFTSDGDAVQYLMDRGFHDLVWERAQGHRYGWTINPVLPDLAPLVWNDYVANRSEVSLLAGFSGAGYVNPGAMDATGLQAYLQATGRYMDRTGLRTILVDWRDLVWNAQVADLYYNTLHEHGLLGLIVGGGQYRQWGGLSFRYSGVPAPGAYFAYEPVSAADRWIIDDLLSQRTGEILLDVAHYDWAEGQVVSDAAAEDGEALLFTSEQPTGWIQGPFVELPAGDYSVTYRLKMEDVAASLPIARIYVGETEAHSAQEFVARELTPQDFVPGEYQDFTLSFTLDHWASRVELGLVPYNGTNWSDSEYATANLWADSVQLSREGGLDFPVFSMMALIVTAPVQSDVLDLVDQMESAGILVLTPDEYMAALNPETMIEFATPLLGADHQSLVQAQALLERGEFFQSLLAVRKGLSDLTAP